MIRPAAPADTPAIVDVVVAAGMFTREEAGAVEGLLASHFDTSVDGESTCVVDDVDGTLAGVAYAEPRAAADRVAELVMLAVAPDRHRGGHGTALLEHIEATARHQGLRLLVIETSSLASYAPARAFYLRAGYDEEARVRDYWTDGDDMVLFRKTLATV